MREAGGWSRVGATLDDGRRMVGARGLGPRKPASSREVPEAEERSAGLVGIRGDPPHAVAHVGEGRHQRQ